MKLIDLTIAIIGINAAIDTRKYSDVSLEEIKGHIENGDVFQYVQSRAKDDIDLSLLDRKTIAEITDALRDIQLGYGGQEKRKWGVENNGLCLLVAWLNELIQQRRWKD